MKVKVKGFGYQFSCDGCIVEYHTWGLVRKYKKLFGYTSDLILPVNSILLCQERKSLLRKSLVFYLFSTSSKSDCLKYRQLKPLVGLNYQSRKVISTLVNENVKLNLAGRNVMLYQIGLKAVKKFYNKKLENEPNPSDEPAPAIESRLVDKSDRLRKFNHVPIAGA